jgi:hypothetical protein
MQNKTLPSLKLFLFVIYIFLFTQLQPVYAQNPRVVDLTELSDFLKNELSGNASFVDLKSIITSNLVDGTITVESQINSLIQYASDNMDIVNPIVSAYLSSKGLTTADFEPTDVHEYLQSLQGQTDPNKGERKVSKLPCANEVGNYYSSALLAMEAGFAPGMITGGKSVAVASITSAGIFLSSDHIYCECINRIYEREDCGRN